MSRQAAQRTWTNKDRVFLPVTLREKEDLTDIFRWRAQIQWSLED